MKEIRNDRLSCSWQQRLAIVFACRWNVGTRRLPSKLQTLEAAACHWSSWLLHVGLECTTPIDNSTATKDDVDFRIGNCSGSLWLLKSRACTPSFLEHRFKWLSRPWTVTMCCNDEPHIAHLYDGSYINDDSSFDWFLSISFKWVWLEDSTAAAAAAAASI